MKRMYLFVLVLLAGLININAGEVVADTESVLRESVSVSADSSELSDPLQDATVVISDAYEAPASESTEATDETQCSIQPRDAEREGEVIDKRYVNGQVLIIIDGIAYDILGRQVSL